MNWKYRVSRKVEEKRAKYVSVMVAEAAVNLGFLKNRTSSIGPVQCSSHHQNRAMKMAPRAKPASTTDEVHPLSGPSMTA